MKSIRVSRSRATAVALAVVLGAAVLSSPLAGPRTAAMRLPDALAASSTRLAFTGFGGRNRGQFAADIYSGEFTRIESRLAIFDPAYVSNRGKGSFSVSGPGIDGSISGECSFKEKVVTIRVVTVDAQKLAFVCDIRAGNGAALGALRLVEPKPEGFKAKLLARADRVGEAEVGSIAFEVRSVHDYQGSRVKAPAPTGYVLSIDTAPVAALELTDVNPTLIVAADLPETQREPALVVSLALAVLRDPANSALGD